MKTRSQEGMDIEKTWTEYKKGIGSKPGLYIVAPDYMKFYKDGHLIHRCGAAGTKHIRIEDRGVTPEGKFVKVGPGNGSLMSRMAMYHSNWWNGGKVYWYLTLHRRQVRSAQNPDQFIEETNEVRHNEVQHYEKEYHKILKELKCEVVKGDEWYKGDLKLKACALKILASRIGAGRTGRILHKFYKDRIEVKDPKVIECDYEVMRKTTVRMYTPKQQEPKRTRKYMTRTRGELTALDDSGKEQVVRPQRRYTPRERVQRVLVY